MRTSVIPPYATYLRVYEPLAAFAPADRAAWEEFVASRTESSEQSTDAALSAVTASTVPDLGEEHQRTISQAVALPPRPVPASEERIAYIMTVDDAPLLCPWQLRLRSWLALGELRRELPKMLLNTCLPPAVMARVEAERNLWRQADPAEIPHILTSTWQPPIGWFVLFDEDERLLRLADDPHERTARYRTPMSQARRRLALALRTLRRTAGETPMAAAVERLGRWLEEFHPRSYVELDYGGLALLCDDEQLLNDHSVTDVASGLAALERGDHADALDCYRTLMERWRRVQEYQHVN